MPDPMTTPSRGVDRRQLLLWGGAGALAAELAAPAGAAAGRGGRRRKGGRTLTLDVACLGDTMRLSPAPGTDPAAGDLYGSPFLVRGVIYKGGTLAPGTGFDPASRPGIGTWFCHGFAMFGPGLTLPDVVTDQEHVLGDVGPGAFGTASLHSSGFEPHDDQAPAPRAVTGGTGRHRGARGVAIESVLGTNATTLPDGSSAPNLRFEFRLRR